jgi:flagellar biosynthesis protein FlhG
MDQAEGLRLLVKQFRGEAQPEIIPKRHDALASSRIIAVTSGKGGVGKTNLTLNLAISLCRDHNKRVLVLDADFGTANVDIVMGMFPRYNISHLFYENKSLEEIILVGPHDVKILPGVSGMANLTNLSEVQKMRFFDELELYQEKYALDYILIDTGAGLSSSVTNFLLASDEIIVVVTPEPTSLSDAYAIIKVMNQFNPDIKTSIVVNMAVSEESAKRVFNTIESVSDKFLNKTLNYLGFMKFDKHLPTAVRQQKPLVLSYPNSDVSLEILRLANTLDSKIDPQQKTMRNFFELAGKYFGWNND